MSPRPLIKARSNSHWYSKDGKAVYEVPMASKKGQMRPTTLADARKMLLLPSVTNIIGILEKPMLTAWKIEQAILAALTLPRIDGESLDDHARRVARDASSQAEDAAKLGTLIHDAVEQFVLFGAITNDPVVRPKIEPLINWWRENCVALHYSEEVVVNIPEGYAGRLDAKANIKGHGICVIDFKSRTPSADGTLRVYDEDAMQLAAYMEADGYSGMSCPVPASTRATKALSVIISSQEPALYVHPWSGEEIEHAYTVFRKMADLWRTLKKYNPSTGKKI